MTSGQARTSHAILPPVVHAMDSLPPCRPVRHKTIQDALVRLTSEVESKSAEEPTLRALMDVPPIFPGSNAADLELPEMDAGVPFAEQKQKVLDAYADVPNLPASPQSTETPITLAELQRIALENSPDLAAAAARVEQARGQALQAGLYPNPQAGYTADSINTADTAGYHGVFASQTIVTADKIPLRQSVEWQAVQQAEFQLRQSEIDVATRVRRAYFRGLVAQQRLEFARQLSELLAKTYRAQIELVAAGEAAGYEPLQLRVFVVQSQNAVVEAEQTLKAAWRELAALLNQADRPFTMLDGSLEIPAPEVDYDVALAQLSQHTEIAIARAEIARNELNICLQRAIPVPDVDVAGAVQYDDTSPLNDVAFNLEVGFRLPVFDKNQGNLYTAESRLVESHHQLTATENRLRGELAQAFARYQVQQTITSNYRDEILPDQVRTYRGVYRNYRQGGQTLDFSQIAFVQQQLSESLQQYLSALETQWSAVIDLAELLQADNLFHLDVRPTPASDEISEPELLIPEAPQ